MHNHKDPLYPCYMYMYMYSDQYYKYTVIIPSECFHLLSTPYR